MKTILLAYDGTEQSERALARAADVAKAFDAAVHVTSVTPMRGSAHGMGPYDPTDPPSEHTAAARGCTGSARQQGIAAVLAPAHGDPVEAILEIADKVDADLSSSDRTSDR